MTRKPYCPRCETIHSRFRGSCPHADDCPVCGGDHGLRTCPERRERSFDAADVSSPEAAARLDPTIDR